MNRGDEMGPDELFELLAAIGDEVDPPTPEVAVAAQAAFAWRTVDAELAELVYDSWADDRELAGVRTGGGARHLTFDAPELTVEVEIDMGGDGICRLVGQVVPPCPGVVEVRHPERSVAAPVDRLGRFTFDRVPSGHISLRCRADGVPAVDTTWIVA